jgi:hypothetical protein
VPNSATIERNPTGVTAPAPPAARRPRALRPPAGSTLFGLVFALAFFLLELRPLLDNSFLWHLKTGHWILDHHRIPDHDLFSFTAPGTPWVVQSWLAEVLYAAVDRAFGSFGLRLLRAGTAAAIAFLVFKLAAHLVGDRVRGALLTLATIGMAIMLWAERPLLFGVLAMVILVWVVEVPGSRVGRHPLIVIPPVLWIWANMHGTFAVGFGFLVLHLAGRALDGHRPTTGRERTLLVATVVAGLACLANPIGLSLLTFPLDLLSRGDTLSHIREWQSPDFHSPSGLLFAVWMGITVAAMVRGRERCSRRDVLVTMAFMFLGLWALRNLVLTPIVVLPVLARALAVDPARRQEDRRAPRQWLVVGLLVVIGWTGAAQAAATAGYDYADYPVKAMQAVEQQGLLGRHLLTTDEWAAYVIDQYWPRQPVFIDDRYDMYPTALAEDYFTVTQIKPGWQAVLDRHQVDVIVWRAGRPLTQLLDLAPGWQRVHEDKLSVVWVRRNAATPPQP